MHESVRESTVQNKYCSLLRLGYSILKSFSAHFRHNTWCIIQHSNEEVMSSNDADNPPPPPPPPPPRKYKRSNLLVPPPGSKFVWARQSDHDGARYHPAHLLPRSSPSSSSSASATHDMEEYVQMQWSTTGDFESIPKSNVLAPSDDDGTPSLRRTRRSVPAGPPSLPARRDGGVTEVGKGRAVSGAVGGDASGGSGVASCNMTEELTPRKRQAKEIEEAPNLVTPPRGRNSNDDSFPPSDDDDDDDDEEEDGAVSVNATCNSNPRENECVTPPRDYNSDADSLFPSDDDDYEEEEDGIVNVDATGNSNPRENGSCTPDISGHPTGLDMSEKKRPKLKKENAESLHEFNVPPVERYEPDAYYFASMWGDRMRVTSCPLSKGLPPHVMTTRNGEKFRIVFSDLIKRKGRGFREDRSK